MSDLHVHPFHMWTNIVTNDLEISVEDSYQIWVDVPRHFKEPF